MKVAYLTTYYNGAIDGRFGRFHDWVHALRDAEDPPFEFEVVALAASAPDETLSSPPHALLGEATDLWGSPLNNVEFALNAPRALRDLRRMDYDVIHVLTLDTIAYPVGLALSDRSPVIGPDIQGYFPGRKGDRWALEGVAGLKQRTRFRVRKRLLRAARNPTVVALSDYHASNVEKLEVDRSRIECLPPGVDRTFSPSDEPPSHEGSTEFLYLGDLSEYKGFPLFVNALASLPETMDWKATVIGSGEVDGERLADLEIADRVTVEGFVQREDLPEFYRRADLYVMPSVDENGPNTIVEALACGTPVLATDRPGINEYVPDGAGVFFDRTVPGIRSAMVEATRTISDLTATARRNADDFGADSVIDALAGLYEYHATSR